MARRVTGAAAQPVRARPRGNLATGLRRSRGAPDPMAAHDRLPAGARAWACQAVLPWSAASIGRLWRKALAASGGCEAAARDRLNAAERARLSRDTAAPAPVSGR